MKSPLSLSAIARFARGRKALSHKGRGDATVAKALGKHDPAATESHALPSMAKTLKFLYLICRKKGTGDRDMTARARA